MQEIKKAGFRDAPGTFEDELQGFVQERGETLKDFRSSLDDGGYDSKKFRRLPF